MTVQQRGPGGAGPRAARPRPWRWLRVGPGLVLALVAIAVVWRHLPEEGRPPRIERTRLDAALNPPATAPDPAWLVQQQEVLGLTAPQRRRLVQLRARWDRDTGALREALGQASSQFDRSMGTGADRRTTLEQLRERAAPVSELSRQLVSARRAWWDEAATVLTATQRQKAEQAWAGRFSMPSQHDRDPIDAHR